MKFKDTKYGDLTGQTYKGNIDVSDLGLTSLEGAPKSVDGYFDCSNTSNLTSLKGAPKSVSGYFSCSGNPKLTSLKGAPENVGASFYCSHNPKLKSLKGTPKNVFGSFWCSYDVNLISLDGISKNIGSNFYCNGNLKLTQSEVDKLVKCDIKGKIIVSKGLKAPIKEDFKLYKKLGDRKYWKLKSLKDSL